VEILCRAGCGDEGADRTADGLHVSQGRSEADPAEFGEESGIFAATLLLRWVTVQSQQFRWFRADRLADSPPRPSCVCGLLEVPWVP
ncbi:MAG: hypothetical protein ACK5YE_26405, partial [Planctomyces sp.]